jgi:hypothetical protein
MTESRNRDIATSIGAAVAADNIATDGSITGTGGGVTVYADEAAILAVDTTGLASGTLAYSDADDIFVVYDATDDKWNRVVFDEFALGDTPAASGGTETTYIDGSTTYKIHTFTSSGDFVVTKTIPNIEYLVVAGGGSGAGYYYSGGGGAGGYRTSLTGATSGRNTSAESKLTLIAGTYSIVVGAGGGAISTSTQGNDGSDSTFATITSVGGGGGGYNTNGSDGGSGGGAGQGSNRQGGSGTAGQGFDGGDLSSSGNTYGGGGGGGAAAAGQNGATGDAGDGGSGLSLSFDAASAVFRAGGGGGASGANAGRGTGGAGGGGSGGAYTGAVAPTDGTVNTGGGGGGASHAANASGTASGAGGSGIVIIRYVDA